VTQNNPWRITVLVEPDRLECATDASISCQDSDRLGLLETILRDQVTTHGSQEERVADIE
jgi:hypothetical protein